MKKIIALLLASVLLLGLAACGAAQPAATQGAQAPAGETNAATQGAPIDPNQVVLGKWEVKMRTPDGETAQYLQFNEDGTGAYELYEADADGVLQLVIPVAEEAKPRKITVAHEGQRGLGQSVEGEVADSADKA